KVPPHDGELVAGGTETAYILPHCGQVQAGLELDLLAAAHPQQPVHGRRHRMARWEHVEIDHGCGRPPRLAVPGTPCDVLPNASRLSSMRRWRSNWAMKSRTATATLAGDMGCSPAAALASSSAAARSRTWSLASPATRAEATAGNSSASSSAAWRSTPPP